MKKILLFFVVFIFVLKINSVSGEEFKEPLNLKACIETGLSRNTDLKIAKENVKKARAYLLQNFSAFLPKIYANYNYISADSPGAGRVADETFLQAPSVGNIQINQDLFKGGESYYNYLKARLSLEKELQAYYEKRNKIIYDIINTYYELLLNEKLEELNARAINRMEGYSSNLMGMSKTGEVHKYEILRSKIEVENLESDSLNFEKEKKTLETRLKKLLMIPGPETISVIGELVCPEEKNMTNYDIKDLSNKVYNTNLTVKVAELSSKIGKQALNAAYSRYAPQASLKSTFYESSNKFNLGGSYEYNWSLVLNFKLPLFDGFDNSSQISQLRSEYSRLETVERFIKDEIRLDLEEATANLEKTKKLLSSQRSVFSDADEALNMSFTLYQRGDVDQSDIIDSNFNYMRSQFNLLKFTKDYYILVAKVKYLMSELDEAKLAK